MRGLRINCIRCVSPAFGTFQETLQRLGWCPFLVEIICRLDRCRACRERNTNNAIAINGDSARASLLGGADRAGNVCLCDLGWTPRHYLLHSRMNSPPFAAAPQGYLGQFALGVTVGRLTELNPQIRKTEKGWGRKSNKLSVGHPARFEQKSDGSLGASAAR
jgi:hypothetical protein